VGCAFYEISVPSQSKKRKLFNKLALIAGSTLAPGYTQPSASVRWHFPEFYWSDANQIL